MTWSWKNTAMIPNWAFSSPIKLIKPLEENQIWYCHGHEFDPTVEYLPRQIIWVCGAIASKITPSRLKEADMT